MAKPANELDTYVTYTYHFELHCAKSWDELRSKDVVSEAATTAFASNGTLMINTRKDAHQTIDDVQIDCIGPSTTLGDSPSGLTELRMSVKEPGGFSFIEKLKARMNELDISEIANAVFGLKVIFVGRNGDNSIEIKQLRIIPLCLINMTGSFTHEGGLYQLEFICYDTLASTRGGEVGQHLNYAFTNKNMAFEANTVEEALTQLELRLNENYAETYKKELNNNGGSKKLQYKIQFDSNIRGPVAGVVKNSFATDDLKKFSFHPSQSITSVIMDIIKRCPQLCDRIGGTSDALSKPLHQGAFMPVITPKVYPKNDVVEVVFDVSVYQGGGQKFEFDYFFSGKNVDIMSYNIIFQQVTAFLATKTKTGADTGMNFSATVPTEDAKRYMNLIHEPVTQTELKYRPVERSDIDRKSGDVAMSPAPSKRTANGNNSMPFTAVQSVRKASDAIAEYAGAIEPEQVLTIRGHYQILELCISRPDELDTTRLAAGGGVWTKVNIYMPDGVDASGTTQYKKFFYDGYYQIIVVTSQFTGGVFTQVIRMVMNEGFSDE
jgi:hypothetical protein